MRIFFGWLRRWAQALRGWIWGRRAERSRRYTAVWVQDIPDAIEAGLVYLVGGDQPAFAVMMCPCGCGAHLHINFLSETRPCWRWDVGPRGEVTLHPSLWRKRGCGSHFFVRGGRIVWA